MPLVIMRILIQFHKRAQGLKKHLFDVGSVLRKDEAARKDQKH